MPNTPAAKMLRVLCILMFALGTGVICYSMSQYSSSSNNSDSSAADTYVGTQTFTIASVTRNSPSTATGSASIQINSSSNMLGPVLFGKITNGSFTREAINQDDTTYPMTGTLSGGTLQASYRSSSSSVSTLVGSETNTEHKARPDILTSESLPTKVRHKEPAP